MYHVNLIANLLEHRPVFKQLAVSGFTVTEAIKSNFNLL